MDMTILFYFLIGAAIVFAFAVNYFNQPGYKFADESITSNLDQEDLMLEPALPKHLTDRFEYTLYLAAYAMVTEIIYVLLVLFLPYLIKGDEGNTISALSPTKEHIVLSALIITGIAPNLPYVRQFLERSKLYLHDKAQIPRKGRDVYRKIKSYPPHYKRAEVTKILKDERYLIEKEGKKIRPDLNESDFKIGSWTLEGRWAKLSYLLSFVNRWSRTSPFRSYIGNRELRCSSVQQAYDDLQKKIVVLRKGDLSEQETARINGLVDATLHRTYRLISCLLYLAGKTDSAVEQFLDQIGYASTERNEFPIPWKNIVYVIGAIVTSIFVGGFTIFLAAKLNIIDLAVDIKTDNIFLWTGYALPFIAIPVVWVLFIKRYFSSHSEAWPVITEKRRYKKAADRPWHVYFVVAVTSYLVGGIVLLLSAMIVNFISAGSIENPLAIVKSISVWSLLVFVITFFAAYRMDSAPNYKRPRTVRIGMRVSGAIIQGVVTASVIFLVFMHTQGGNINPGSMPELDKGKLGVYLTIGFLLGFLLYLSFGFGKLRQRRESGRRIINRPVVLFSGQEKTTGCTINISKEGALIECDEYIADDQTDIKVSDSEGHSAIGNIIRVRRNYLHIHFPDKKAWGLVQNNLEIPAYA